MSALDIRDFHSLDELRGNLLAYVQKYNQTVHSSLKGMTPQERFFSEPGRIHRLPDETIESSFLLEIDRRVSSDSVIVIDQVEYEVDCRVARQRIKLRYSPDFKDIFISFVWLIILKFELFFSFNDGIIVALVKGKGS